jgi:NTE family protein
MLFMVNPTAGVSQHTGSGRDLTGVVLAGAGARGAYEAGVLSVLLPALEARGHSFLFVATSAGALNAGLFASFAQLPMAEAAERVLNVWRRLTRSDVIRSVPATALVTTFRYAADFLGVPVRLMSLLDTAPLRRSVGRLDWDELHRNIRTGAIKAVAMVTTACVSGRTVIFVECAGLDLPPSDHTAAIDYVSAELTVEHALASAAIPMLFPAVRITTPAAASGWYMDGGVRQNTPIKPAIALGVDRLVVVATDPASYPPAPLVAQNGTHPEVEDVTAQVLHAALVDRMIEDVRTLGKINELVAVGKTEPRPGGRAYREIPYLFVGPEVAGQLGRDADEIFRSRYGNAPWWRDFPFLSRLMGRRGPSHGELLSFLFFEPAFLQRAIERGQQDAQAVLAATEDDIPWRTGLPLPPHQPPPHKRSRRRL